MAEVVLETAHGGKVGSLPVFGVTDASYWVWHVGAGFGRVVSSSCCSGVVIVVAGEVPSCRALLVCAGSGCGVSFSSGFGVSA